MQFIRRNGLFLSSYLLVAVTVWIVFMIVLPQLYMIDFSFRPNLPLNEIGGPKDQYTLDNYRYLVFGRPTDEALLNWLHLKVFFKTIIASVCVTLLAFWLCYPLAYYMAQVAHGSRTRLLVLLLILPFWVNEILRAFAFRLLFGTGGMINEALVALGLLDQPIDFAHRAAIIANDAGEPLLR